MKEWVIILAVLVSNAFAGDVPKSIVHYTQKGTPGSFIELRDPHQVVIKLDSGQVIQATHEGNDFEAINKWEEKPGNKKRIALTYTSAEGVVVRDQNSGFRFKLSGVINPHPVDLAYDKCTSDHSSTLGMQACQALVLEAWDAELNRAYKGLGGSNNTALQKAQRDWLRFRDSTTAYLREEFSSRSGSIAALEYGDYEISLIKEQANRLKAILSDGLAHREGPE